MRIEELYKDKNCIVFNGKYIGKDQKQLGQVLVVESEKLEKRVKMDKIGKTRKNQEKEDHCTVEQSQDLESRLDLKSIFYLTNCSVTILQKSEDERLDTVNWRIAVKSEYLILTVFCTRASESRVALNRVVTLDSCIRLAQDSVECELVEYNTRCQDSRYPKGQVRAPELIQGFGFRKQTG